VTAVETVARARPGNGSWADRLHCHPRFPLVAWLDSGHPAVHVWDYGTGELREAAAIGSDSRAYGDGHWLAPRNPEFAAIFDREERSPAVAWHPERPLLFVASEGTVTQWTPGGISAMDGLPPEAAYRYLSFSPDGQALWASPSRNCQDLWINRAVGCGGGCAMRRLDGFRG
jgi:hypothetical protein